MPKSWQKESAIVIAIALILVYALPFAINTFTLSVLLIYGMLGLSLGLIWGFGGILCFGQTAFFGLGAKVRKQLPVFRNVIFGHPKKLKTVSYRFPLLKHGKKLLSHTWSKFACPAALKSLNVKFHQIY